MGMRRPMIVNFNDAHGRANAATAQDMRELGRQLGSQLTAGTVVVLTGPLGAGKTTLTQGIADGLGVKGRVQSPTFTIVRSHKPGGPGKPGMLHMDAYRLLGQDVADGVQPGLHVDRAEVLDALESLDIDVNLDGELGGDVVIAEWGRGVVEVLSTTVLDVEITRAEVADAELDLEAEQPRTLTWRWL
ncbi:tRNA (adenosine(37)-N6)-threonylcarbamoyltransferase complex ATPase subunit type 1 TsaE [Corynebacterium sp. zg254]|uniref:tRNA threonylcarbamoyladenosine biosynthesis protein TsaE n=2 Tax=Corynebacteriaceae TaxID=1653 RepID=A0ABQ6VIH4_9CORY|nr:tRNA (adenosine(37)-N6)-threonylcarbamoyltransferase complex ATPase subunit type 1 TsaE [Corynebacterium zhongnanshanii]MCR5914031.1 tRNA (adenosine(37)-N6)-threonylcarbamoyltransferase complex ATPase subunit type 1 TsaE [Corynebacterium sp. zg254]